MAVFLCYFVFFLLAWSFSRSETDVNPVQLSPVGNVELCPKENVTFTCRTIGGALLWRTTGEATGRVFNDEAQASSDLGIFRLSVSGVRKEGSTVVEVNSTATTLTGVQPEDDNITLTCLIATNFTSEKATLRVAGLDSAPVVTSIMSMQSGINSSSLLIMISWNMSDCAVQYVVTINSSDGSVYSNITTSDTNTTVTLPNGVEYCVTVAAVDVIGRRVQDSRISCHDTRPTPTVSIEASSKFFFIETTSTINMGTASAIPTQSFQSAIDMRVVIAVIAVVLCGIIVAVITVMIAVILLLCRKRSKSKSKKHYLNNDTVVYSRCDYTCLVFFQNKKKNVWSFIYAISHKNHCHEVEEYFSDKTDRRYKSCDFQFERGKSDIIVTFSNLSDTWKGGHELSVSRTAVKQYNGKGEPPHCVMTVEPAADDVTPSDISFNVDLNGKRSLTINEGFEAQNVTECSVQVFYHYVNVNWWKVIVAFFPTEQQKQVEQIYQDANISSHQPLHFCGGNISIVAQNTTGWCTLKPDDEEHQEVKTAAIDRYNCDRDGEPPYCELALKAVSDTETPPDLSLTVTLFGAKNPNTIILNRVAMTPEGVPRPVPDGAISTANSAYACQVFYYRININHWRATFAFFPVEKTERVKEFFQDANTGPTIAVVFATSAHINVLGSIVKSSVKPGLIDQRESNKNGWTVMPLTGKDIYIGEIENYTGKGKPPHFGIILKPSSDNLIPSDHLNQSIILTGVKPPNSIELERAVEKIPLPLASDVNSSADVTNGVENDDQS